jgi:GDPmannose 4,6-dehydratase
VEIDERFFRPTDIALGFGDAAKAAKILGWRAKTRMPGVATRMAQAEQC